jgi:mono/diheme cytochrome c family protein
MAASDQTYRNQKGLDVVFGVSCVLMLVSVIWMFQQDYSREFKVEQRDFRDVEAAVAERQMLNLVPDQQLMEQIDKTEQQLAEAAEERDREAKALSTEMKQALTHKVEAEAKAQAVKADRDSILSIYNIAVEERDAESEGSSRYKTLEIKAEKLRKNVDDLNDKLNTAQAKLEEATRALDEVKQRKKKAEDAVTTAQDRLKKMTADFDRFAKLAYQKRWKFGDTFRALPVLDAFSSPTRIQQYTLNDLPIDYNFKYVTRYDRCTTCHLGFDRPAYDRQSLRNLGQEPSEELTDWLENESARIYAAKSPDDLDAAGKPMPEELTVKPLANEVIKLRNARRMLKKKQLILRDEKERKGSLEPDALVLTSVKLNEARINEFAAHPRLDLFVAGDSKHPAEKFGCSTCHAGQGSATEFNLASHTPNDYPEKARWKSAHHWEANHFWDFAMLPKRFLESGCLKCHYQVTDLLPEGNKVEIREGLKVDTPGAKVVRGYDLVRENGCFGCHEIAGVKDGRFIGPDLRLEPNPSLEALSPADRAKATADPLNAPGTMRRVGPGLRRISEKTNEKWTWSWIRAPRDFRPSTRMPHFYGLSNNSPEALEGTGQEDFPDAEIHAVTYYLFSESKAWLKGQDKFRLDNLARHKELTAKQKENPLSEQEKKELEEVNRRLVQFPEPTRLSDILKEVPPAAEGDKTKEHLKKGRELFTKKGCLACHSHQGTTKAEYDLPVLTSQAQFGPDLSRLAAKLGTKPGDKGSARRWLIQWIMDPKVHSRRTLMPVTHLSKDEAAAVADWLLSQEAKPLADPPPEDTDALEGLARISLEKSMARQDVTELFQNKGLAPEQFQQIRSGRPDADELKLDASADDKWENKLKWYVGKKAIGQLGCFGCHDIPGFEVAKPIGTPLNDWGKKDPERIAFEDVNAFVKDHYHAVPLRDDPKDKTKPAKDWFIDGKALPYEQFYADALEHRHREGFLHQKLMEPRSYDCNRMRTWEDRLRMPQFRFSRKVIQNLSEEELAKLSDSEKAKIEEQGALIEKEEAEAREDVMTFILGLTAEPIPLINVYEPPPERLALAKGIQLLEKYNCVGCHQVRPGEYDFKITPDILDQLEERAYKEDAAAFASDHHKEFANQNEWTGRPQTKADRLSIKGMPDPNNENSIRLTEALRFTNKAKETRDVPASTYIPIPTEQEGLVGKLPPLGGVFVNLMAPYLAQTDDLYKDYKNARAALPPPLMREGEKTQPAWLFQFLRDPSEIRPMKVLRMPKFSLSDEEAMTLVNYFAAVDKSQNPSNGLVYPYNAIPQRDEDFWRKQTAEYVERLNKDKQYEKRLDQLQDTWNRLLSERIADAESAVKAAKEAQTKEKDADKKKELSATLDKATSDLDELQKIQRQIRKQDKKAVREVSFVKDWEQEEAYAVDAFRLLTNYNNPCMGCHNVGALKAKNRKEEQGPPLDLAWQRLRPEWTERWIANPERLISYPTPMPANFRRVDPPYPEFDGTLIDQIRGVRDVLLYYPKVADMPANRYYRTAPGGGS